MSWVGVQVFIVGIRVFSTGMDGPYKDMTGWGIFPVKWIIISSHVDATKSEKDSGLTSSVIH